MPDSRLAAKRAGPPTSERAFNILSEECGGAELVSVVLQTSTDEGLVRYLNGWSCLRYLGESEEPEFAFLTDKPRSLPALVGRPRLIASRTSLTIEEARQVVPTRDSFVDPHAPEPSPVEVAGEWLPSRIAGIDEGDVRNLLPLIPQTLYSYEKRPGSKNLEALLGDAGLRKFLEMTQELLGVDLSRHPHRIGSYLVAVPCSWPEVACRSSRGRERLGIELRGTKPVKGSCAVVLDELGDRSHERSQCQLLPDGLHVMDTRPGLGRYELRVYGQDGLLRHLEQYALFGGVHSEIQVHGASGRVSLDVNGEKVSASYSWASTLSHAAVEATVSPEVAERDAIAEREERAKLDSGKVLVFSGEASERPRALVEMRKLLNSAKSHVWIVDPYFGRREVVEFVTSLARPDLELRILVSGDNRETARDAMSELNTQLSTAGVRQLTCWEVRAPSATALHDRFVAIDGRWWQLGTSLNSLGNNMSTLTEFPAPKALSKMFDKEWARAR